MNGIFYLLLLLISSPALSQILNVEKDRLDADTANVWLGNTGLTFNARHQQVNVLTFNTFTNIAHLSRLHDYIFIGNINLVKIKGKEVISDGYGHFRINWWRRHPVSAETFFQLQYDESRGLRQRRLAGGGVRYKIHHSNKVLLALGTGLMAEYERWHFGEETKNTFYLKSTSYASIHWEISQHLNANVLSYYQARPEAFFHPRFIADANLLMSINRHFSLTTRFTTTYDAMPVVPIDKLIYAFTGGLAFRF